MDKRALQNTHIFFFFAVIFAILFVTFVICFPNADNIALAEASDAPVTATAVTGATINSDGSITFTRGAYALGGGSSDRRLAKDIKINFPYRGEDYFRIFVTVKGNTIVGDWRTATGEPYEYTVTANGTVVVEKRAYDENYQELNSLREAVTVYSDNVAPTPATVTEMGEGDWVKDGEEFDINVDMTAYSDGESGNGEVWYKMVDANNNAYDFLGGQTPDYSDKDIEIAPGSMFFYADSTSDRLTFRASHKATLYIYYFDRAYNVTRKEYVFDKFDATPPPAPEIFVTPNSDMSNTNGYTSSYTVSIRSYEDGQSGLDKTYYRINNSGAWTEYIGEFNLNEARNYSISAYSVDKSGLASERATYDIHAATFDKTDPTVSNVEISYDVRKENNCTVKFVSYDRQSGIGSVYVVGVNATVVFGTSDVFTVSFDSFGVSGIEIHVVDKVGNEAISRQPLILSGGDLTAKIRSYGASYRNLDINDYTAKSIEELDRAYEALNNLLYYGFAQSGEYAEVFARIDDIIAGKNRLVFTLESQPKYLSGGLTFEVDESDFIGYRKGDEIRVTMRGGNSDSRNYLSMSGFKKGFVDYFSLGLSFRGEEVSPLDNGVRISLNMPVGFYERQYALFDATTGEKVDIILVNNKIEFTLKSSSSYALVISGASEPKRNEETKSITVFGNRLSYGVFFGTIFGIAGVVIIIVVVIIIASKKRSRY